MDRRRFFLIVFFSMVLHISISTSQADDKPDAMNLSLSAAPIYQSASGLDRGGEFSLNHYQFRGSATRSFSNSMHLGFSIGYDYLDFDFGGTTGFAGHRPWSEVHRIGLGLPVFYGTEKWQIFFSPSIDWSAETDADFSEALRYGAALSAVYRISPYVSLGAGAGVFQGLEETNVFPFLTVYWKISDQWRLTNPFSAGPIGPAGLELIHTPDSRWEIGGGGAYRSNRFRLDGHGIAPDGIGQLSGLPVWLRLTRKVSQHYKLDLYGGVLLNGELRIEDSNGRKLGSDDFDPAGFMAVNISASF